MSRKLKLAIVYAALMLLAVIAFIYAFICEQKGALHMAWLNSFAVIDDHAKATIKEWKL